MQTQLKEQIRQELQFQSSVRSQAKLAAQTGVSDATVSHILSGKWGSIHTSLWHKVKVALRLDLNWQHAETRNAKIFEHTLKAVQMKHLSIGISERAGLGKSHAYRRYARKYKNVIVVEGKHYWSKKGYIKALLAACGLDTIGTTEQLIERFIRQVSELEHPLLIIDQADKLKDPQLDLFMDFYNDLYGHCGFVLSGVEALSERLQRGVQRHRSGYCELWSRIGAKFYDKIEKISREDVRLICEANGVSDEEEITEIYHLCEGDLRKVRREVEKRQLLNQKG